MDRHGYMDPARNTRRVITVGLILGGAVAGALVGLAITPLGKMVAGAPPADLANYVGNAVAFGIAGACTAPLISHADREGQPGSRSLVQRYNGG